ncbi:hypothetical protein PFICI_06172 [Pestalotiopsis fici W106-1]|uniref:DUF7357 domain-containing protein n=1 Tax=Pestalotiopsis fici (strain W106-1 / CGMCC3.15140) TaxID=1229662 RepID=W3X534_PESFW|nr:uncharacterized protein PFICI_06172 [Pestalotiopsis fici W106-1]ETS81170.1 hypothetical protein PFICI_06172 [Pestalotiopsis fici W106-1]
MASHLRLRLVVRRNGLPETNIIWPVPLENKPTIAKLLEDVNQILPLESADWGLEDYAVELKGSDGVYFECLHFQPVQSVLKEDDQVFIRPLFTDDIRRRRVSGRHQISNDGRHLIDGLAFGRPLLGAPRGRPVFDIPPRKRRRVGPTEQDDLDEDDEDDADYGEPQEEQEPMLLLTNGEDQIPSRRKSVRIAADFDNLDSDNDLGNENDEEIEDEQLEDDVSMEHTSEEDEDDDMEYEQDEAEDDLEKELEDLQSSAEEDHVQNDEEIPVSKSSANNETRQTSRRASRATAKENDTTSAEPTGQRVAGEKPKDEVGALLTAFPTAPVQVCREVLAAEVGDLRKSYLTLSQAFAPKLPESELLKRWRNRDDHSAEESNEGSVEEDGVADGDVGGDEDLEEDEDDDEDDDDEVTPFIRRFDRQGLPPGSISSGNALKAMAAISKSFETDKSDSNSKSTSQTLTSGRLSFEEPGKAKSAEDEEETSSSGTSSSSEEGEVNDESSSDDASSSDEQSGGDGDAAKGKGPEASDTSSSDDDSDSDSDSAPEERSAKTGAITRGQRSLGNALGPTSPVASSSSSEDSDADDETSSDDSSEDDSSDEDTSSESDSEETEMSEEKAGPNSKSAPAIPSGAGSQEQPSSEPAVYTGVPGAGKISTKKRNARRRVAAKHKAAQSQSAESPILGTTTDSNVSVSVVPDSSTKTTEKSKAEIEKELFEAKRKALLEALASGGVEVGPSGESTLDSSQVSQKRKRDEATPAKLDQTSQQPSSTVTGGNTVNAEEESPSSTQKRRRLDLGAGRRMLFGALGLRNPKSKDDEEKLRDKLMKDVKPLQNARLVADGLETKKPEAEKPKESADVDENAWREKITYRAVECCQEGVELSEPPFPFVQRWDPQQQNAWFQKNNKRGGKGKKAERNQSHFYQQDDSRSRSHDESHDWVENYQDTTFNSAQQLDDVPMELNYDDVEEPDVSKNVDETTRLTDIDDLPSLPKNLDDLLPLRPGEAQNGMVITWKQFILSKATNWQPQVLSLTGVICRIDDDATGLEVMLAKRDRELEQTEKQYDDLTGQRVYDKFDAPDTEDEAEDEETRRMNEGYRTLSFSAIMEPRVLQPAIPLEEASQEPTIPSIEDEPTEPVVPKEISTHAEVTDETTSQPEEVTADVDCTTDLKDTTFEGFDDTVPPEEESCSDASENKVKTPVAAVTNGLDQESEALVEGTAQDPSLQDSEKARSPAEKSVSDLSQVSSPSRQLHDETTSMLYGLSAGDEQSLGPSCDIPSTPSASAPNVDMMVSDPVHDQDETSIQIHETDVIMGTPRFTYPRPEAPPSSTSSVHSGRQLDLSMDLGVDQPLSFRAMTDDSAEMNDVDAPAATGDSQANSNHDEETTPVPPSPQKGKDFDTPKKSTPRMKESPSNKDVADSNASTPCSLASLGTVWCTAVSSRQTQSPSKSQLLSILRSQKSQRASERDLEYEAAMRKLDGFSDDDDEDETSQSVSKISDSFASKSSKLPVTSSSFSAAVNNDWNMGNDPESDRLSPLPTHARTDVAISPPPTSRRRAPVQEYPIPSSSSPPPRIKQRVSPPPVGARRKSERVSSSRFSLPPGTQVLEISSDSDEPKFTEHYADDDKDDTYSPANDLAKDDFSPASLPRGSGWVKKTRLPKSSSAPVASQKKAAKVSRAASASQSSYGSQLKRMESAAAAMKRLNKGRKSSAKF